MATAGPLVPLRAWSAASAGPGIALAPVALFHATAYRAQGFLSIPVWTVSFILGLFRGLD